MSTSLPNRELLDRARLELCCRLQAGENCTAQEYLDTHPSLAQSEEYAVELIVAEFLERRRLRQATEPLPWLERYPRWRERLEQALSQIADLSDSTAAARTTPELPAAPQPADFPRPFRKYILLEELGGGGMGRVYRAYDPGLQREVALKQMHGELKGDTTESDAQKRFQREVQALFDLRHEHVIRLHDNAVRDGYYTMELLRGGSLKQHRGRFKDPRTAAVVVEKIARGVQAAHDKGIIHRDLKPANVLLNDQGEPAVADFGVAKFLAGEDLTEIGRKLGTWWYMSPEQVQGQTERINAQTDIWALGVILYELVCGRLPFLTENSAREVRLQALIRHADPPRPRDLCPGLPLALETIILKCLRKAPQERYTSADELADDLKNWLSGEPIQARPEGWLRRTWRKTRKPFAFAVGVGVGLALVSVLLGFALHKDDPERDFLNDVTAGRNAVAVGEQGIPRRWRCVLGECAPVVPPDGDGTMQVSGLGDGIIEIVPAHKWERYVFEADVCHKKSLNISEVGLAFFLTQQDTALGQEQYFWVIGFAEYGPLAGRLRCYARRTRDEKHPAEPGGKAHVVSSVADSPRVLEKEFALQDDAVVWHHLRLVVSPKEVAVYWENNPLPEVQIPREKIESTAQMLMAGRPLAEMAPPRFLPQQPVGLYVHRSAASFRNVVFRPNP